MHIDLTLPDLKTVTTLLNAFLADTTVWAFGSRVKFTSKPTSDLDLVAFIEPEQEEQLAELKDAFAESDLPFKVDILDWAVIPESFKRNIEGDYIVFSNVNKTQFPQNWTYYKLGKIADVQNGYAFKSTDFSNSGIPIIKIKNIVSPKISFEDVQYYGKPIDNKLKQFLIKTDDIVISMTGSHINQIASAVGKVGRYQYNFPALLNQRVGKLYSKDKTIFDENFFYYFISRPEIQLNLATSAGGGGNQANISPAQIKNLDITIPGINEQKDIASILSSLDDKIELNQQLNQTLETIAQTIFKEWFVNFNFPGFDGEGVDGLPKGWRKGKIEDLFILQRGHDLPAITRTKGLYPVVAASGISTYHHEFKVKGPGVTTGRSGVLGNVFYIEEDFWPLNTSLFIKEYKIATPLFSYYVLNRLNLAQLNGGSAVPTLNRNDVHGIECIVPDRLTIEKFELTARQFFNKKFQNSNQIKSLTEIRDILLPRLMTGKISVMV
jgi:type I restriction enzyme S subunit